MSYDPSIKTGGISIASQAADDLIYAASASQLGRLPLTALQSVRKNAANNALEAYTPSAAGPMTLLKAGSGTFTGSTPTNVDSFTLSGLTILDSIHIYTAITLTGVDSTAAAQIYDTTDSLAWGRLFGNQLVGQATYVDQGLYRVSPGNTKLQMQEERWGNISVAAALFCNDTTLTTDWTGSRTLALQMPGHGGGSYSIVWAWQVYKFAGQ